VSRRVGIAEQRVILPALAAVDVATYFPFGRAMGGAPQQWREEKFRVGYHHLNLHSVVAVAGEAVDRALRPHRLGEGCEPLGAAVEVTR
jgi:hypothetical protein